MTNYEDPATSLNTQRRSSPPSINTNGRNGGDPQQRSNHQSQQTAAARIANIVQNSSPNSPITEEATEDSAHISPTSSSGLPISTKVTLPTFASSPSSRYCHIPQQQQQHTPPPSFAITAAQQRAIQAGAATAGTSTATRLTTVPPPLLPMQAISSATTVLNSRNVSAATILPRMSMVPASYSLPSSSSSNSSSTVAVSATSVATTDTLRNGMDYYRERDHRPQTTQGNYNRTSPPSRGGGLPFYSVAPSSTAIPTSSTSSHATNRYPTSAPSPSVSNANMTTVVPAQPSSSSKHTKQTPSVILGEHGGVKTMIWTDSSLYSQAQAQAQAQAAQAAAEATAKSRVSSQLAHPTHQLIKLEPGIAAQAVHAAQAAKAKLDVDQQMKMSSAVDGLLSLSSIPPPPRTAPTATTNVTHSPQIQHLQVRQQQHLVQHSPRPSHSSPMMPQQFSRIAIPGSQQQGPHTQLNIMPGNNNISPSISPMIRSNNNGPTITSSVTPTPFQTFCTTSSPTPTTPNLPPLPISLPNVNNKRRSPMNMERLWAGDQSQLPAHCLENQVKLF